MTPTRIELCQGAAGLCAMFWVGNFPSNQFTRFNTVSVEQKTETGWQTFSPSGNAWSGVAGNLWRSGYDCFYAVGWPPGLPTNAVWRLQVRYGKEPSGLGVRLKQILGWDIYSLSTGRVIPSAEVSHALVVCPALGENKGFRSAQKQTLPELGKPLNMRFTALDGREVDMAKLRGKVVLVQFWATDCADEMPIIKAAYKKLHSRGFEVVGISLDEKEKDLRRFIKEKELPWPQYFDGKGFTNRFAVQYGISGLWLINKEGNLVCTDIDLGMLNYVEVKGKQICVTSRSKELEQLIAEQLELKDSLERQANKR